MRTINFIKRLSYSVAVCLIVAGSLCAQQPFDSLPTQPQENPQGGQLPSEPPIRLAPRGDRFGVTPGVDALPDVTEEQVKVNTRAADWRGAAAESGADGKRLGNSLRGSWIMTDSNGRFSGQVLPGTDAEVAGMNVYLLHNGRMVKSETVNAQGEFSFANVRQAAYAMVGWGPRGFFCFGLNVLEHNPEKFANAINRVTPTAFQNRTSINLDWIRHFAPTVNFRVYGVYNSGEGANDPNRTYGNMGLYNFLPESIPATSISSHPVQLLPGGKLVGRVHQYNSSNGRPIDLRNTKVILLEGDSQVAVSATDNDGVFEFVDVPAGNYAILAAGVDGVGLIGIEATDQSQIDAEGNPTGGANFVDFNMVSSETIGWLNNTADEVAYQRNLRAPRPQTYQQGMGCAVCNNQPGGCDRCQAEYLRSYCRSRGLTFEQWQMHCQGVKSGFGDGYFFRETGKALRRRIEKIDEFYEKAFYPNEFQYGVGN